MADSAGVFDGARQVSARVAMAMLPVRGGKRFATVFRHGSLQVEIFAPRGRDTQRPHLRDEVYVVVRGSGYYVNGAQRFAFRSGDVLFAAAGEEHHFEEFTEDFFTWVFFYGPDGGEATPG
ncbi:MAG TPA: cupin domain-containing protein [Anaeromyxobacteraceae bacterium]|nr:cupin domain-containing protein [Anaeromyxobacteraceae bacterium]